MRGSTAYRCSCDSKSLWNSTSSLRTTCHEGTPAVINPHAATADLADVTGPTTVDRDAIKALIGSGLGYAMDGFDLLILGFMLKLIAHDLSLSPAQAASLVTATLIGAVIGGIGFGMLSDRIGRVRVLTYTIVVFAVFTGLCGLGPRLLRPAVLSRPLPASGWAASSASAWRWSPRPGRRACAPGPRPMSVSAGSSACWRPPSSRRSCCRSSDGAACSCSAFSRRSRPISSEARCTSRKSSCRSRTIIRRNPLCTSWSRTPRPPSSASA